MKLYTAVCYSISKKYTKRSTFSDKQTQLLPAPTVQGPPPTLRMKEMGEGGRRRQLLQRLFCSA